jgi:hypothetical protein
MGTQSNRTGNAGVQGTNLERATARGWECRSHADYSGFGPRPWGIPLKIRKNPLPSPVIRPHKALANEYQIVVESRSFSSFGTTTWL